MKHLKKFNESNFRSIAMEEWDEFSERDSSKFTPYEIKVINEIFKDYKVRFRTSIFSFELNFEFENSNTSLPINPISHNGRNISHTRWFYCYKDFDEYFDVDCDLGLFRCDQFDGFVEFAKWYVTEWEESNKHQD